MHLNGTVLLMHNQGFFSKYALQTYPLAQISFTELK